MRASISIDICYISIIENRKLKNIIYINKNCVRMMMMRLLLCCSVHVAYRSACGSLLCNRVFPALELLF